MDIGTALSFARNRSRGVIVTLRRDGMPQMSNIAYAIDDSGLVRVSVTDSRAKTANARRDPRGSLYVTSEDFWSYVVVDGSVTLSPVARERDDPTVEELVALYRSLRGEHPNWQDFRSAMVSESRLVLRLQPERAYGIVRA